GDRVGLLEALEEAVRRRRLADEVHDLFEARRPALRRLPLDDGVVLFTHAAGYVADEDDLGRLARLLPVLPGRQHEDGCEDGVDAQAQQGQEAAPEPADAVAVADVHPDDVDDADAEDAAEDEVPGVAGELVPADREALRDAAEDELARGGGGGFS